MKQRVVAALSETGATFAVALEGVRHSWDVRHWWREYVLQSLFLVKVPGEQSNLRLAAS